MKIKNLIVASSLLLVTAGVFAGRAKFVAQDIYVDLGGGSYTQLATTSAFNDLSTNNPGSPWVQAKIVTSRTGAQKPLVADDGGTKVPLYTQGTY